jgi:hypothetical protein
VDRARGTTITLVLDIAAETVDGFSEDVETRVRDNADFRRSGLDVFGGDRFETRSLPGRSTSPERLARHAS